MVFVILYKHHLLPLPSVFQILHLHFFHLVELFIQSDLQMRQDRQALEGRDLKRAAVQMIK